MTVGASLLPHDSLTLVPHAGPTGKALFSLYDGCQTQKTERFPSGQPDIGMPIALLAIEQWRTAFSSPLRGGDRPLEH